MPYRRTPSTGGSGASTALTPTATKTATYTAAVGELAMMNVAGGATALTLPTAPADGKQVAYRAIGATAAVPLTVTAGGSDTIGLSGATSATIALADETVVLQYQAANTRWIAVSNVKTQTSLDTRYAPLGATRAVTLIVAASSASASVKAAADYVCTGTNDHATINTALGAIPAAGGSVVLSEGTFTLGDSVSITASNVQLRGSGRGTLVKITAAVTNLHIIRAVGASGAPLTGVHVGNLRVQGYGDNQNTGALANGVHFSYCNNSTVENVWGHDVKWAVVSLHDCQRCIVNNVHIEAGTLGVSGGWYGVSADNPDITGNYAGHVITNITSEAPHHAVAMQSVAYATVSNVTAMNMVDSGADPYVLNWQDCSNILAKGIVGINVPGLYYIEKLTGAGCDKCSLTNYTAILTQTTGHPGIYVSNSFNTLIANGHIDGTNQLTYDAIYVDNTSTAARVVNNTVVNAARCGIFIDANADDTEVSRNKVTNSRGSGATDAGIRMSGLLKGRIESNNVETSAGYGINAAQSTGIVANNIVKSSTKSGVLASGQDMLITGNVSTNNTTYGFELASTALRARLGGNFAQTNPSGNYLLTAPTSLPVLVSDNKGLVKWASSTTSRTLTAADQVLFGNATGGAIVYTLPAVANVQNGQTYTIGKSDASANTVTVKGNGTELVSGSNTQVISTQWGVLRVVSDGTAWYLV